MRDSSQFSPPSTSTGIIAASGSRRPGRGTPQSGDRGSQCHFPRPTLAGRGARAVGAIAGASPAAKPGTILANRHSPAAPPEGPKAVMQKRREGLRRPSLVMPVLSCCLLGDQASSARSARVASTITLRAAVVSSQPRVLRPQSGLTQSRSAGICCAALRMRSSIQPWLGTFGEWMS